MKSFYFSETFSKFHKYMYSTNTFSFNLASSGLPFLSFHNKPRMNFFSSFWFLWPKCRVFGNCQSFIFSPTHNIFVNCFVQSICHPFLKCLGLNNFLFLWCYLHGTFAHFYTLILCALVGLLFPCGLRLEFHSSLRHFRSAKDEMYNLRRQN